MANEIDFLELYRQLRVSPDCSVDEFKRAYRRCVSTLHPDRTLPGHEGYKNSRSGQRLQQLNVQYDAAMEFLRLHGRLPGAPPPAFVASQRVNPPRPTPAPSFSPPRTSRRPHMKWLILVALLATGILFWGASAVTPSSDGGNDSTSHDSDTAPSDAPAAPMLTLGMSPENVRAIEGRPVEIRDDLWEYGPSWVRFDHGSVVDWYSSPLHSLKTAQTRPSGARN